MGITSSQIYGQPINHNFWLRQLSHEARLSSLATQPKTRVTMKTGKQGTWIQTNQAQPTPPSLAFVLLFAFT